MPLKSLNFQVKPASVGDVHYNLLEMASGAEVNGKMLHDKREKKLLEHHSKKDETNIHIMDAATTAQS